MAVLDIFAFPQKYILLRYIIVQELTQGTHGRAVQQVAVRAAHPHAEFIAVFAGVDGRLFGVLMIEEVVRQTEVPQRCDLPFPVNG